MKRKEQNPVRLVLFFSFCFAAVFAAAVLIRFLEIRIGEFRTLPGMPVTRLPEFISSFQWALVPALYLSILLSLSYTSRRKIPIPLSIPLLFALGLAVFLGLSLGIERLRALPPPLRAEASPLMTRQRGLILSQAGVTTLLLGGMEEPRGPRVLSLPGEPLIYQEVPLGPNSSVLPPLPFRNETSSLLKGLSGDFSLSARQFEARLREGVLSLAIYGASLILFLVSLRFILDIGNWPLASLFLGALAFRGVLTLETFLNTGEVQAYLASFVGKTIPQPLISPLAFFALALLILLYTALISLVKVRRAVND